VYKVIKKRRFVGIELGQLRLLRSKKCSKKARDPTGSLESDKKWGPKVLLTDRKKRCSGKAMALYASSNLSELIHVCFSNDLLS
jgi:hypothetical protein